MKRIGLILVSIVIFSLNLIAQGNGQYHEFDLDVDGTIRQYTLYAPEGHDATEEWPLVILLHGFGTSIDDQIQVSQMYLVADTAKFLIVYPQGVNVYCEGLGTAAGWNVPDWYVAEHDDIAYFRKIISDLNYNPDFKIGLNRIHSTGYSNGGEMSFYLASALSDQIASVAGISAQMQTTRTHPTWVPIRPISVLHMQGTRDIWYPEDGGGTDSVYSIGGVAEYWAGINGCNADPDTTYLPDINQDDSTTVSLIHYGTCNNNTEVLSYQIEKGGHYWPGGWHPPNWLGGTDYVNIDIHASVEVWNFFKRNPRPSNTMMVEIPDTAFLYALIEEGVDTNGDSLISTEEAEAITSLDVQGGQISDLTGIEAFVYLDSLNCHRNYLTRLDVSKNTALLSLVVGCVFGTNGCYPNQLTCLDVSKNTALISLICGNNQITSLDVSGCPNLIELYCHLNNLTSLDISGCTALKELRCYGNQLTSLDISGCTSLMHLYCSGNQLISLDISNNLLIGFDCPGCTLLDLSNMPTLGEICVWETFEDNVGYKIVGSPNVCFQTDCNGDCTIAGVEGSSYSGLTIYPNPTNSILTIETDQPDHYSIEISSLNGQLINSTEMEGTTHQIDLSTFQKGVYFITVRSKDFVTTRKIIKL